jgi:hypothetical protein
MILLGVELTVKEISSETPVAILPYCKASYPRRQLLLLLWLYSPLLGTGRFFNFLMVYIVGRTPWTGDQPVARPVCTHRTTQTQNKRTQTPMPWVRFEPMIPAFERAKTFHALDRAANVIGLKRHFFPWHYSPNLGLGLPPWNSPFHFGFLDLRQSVELLGRVISSSQGLYLYTKTEKRIHTNNKHPCREWDSNSRSLRWSEWRQFMP